MFVQEAWEGAWEKESKEAFIILRVGNGFCVLFVFSLKNGYAPVEFFLEGTRSRSAKTLTPKFGRSLQIKRKNTNPKTSAATYNSTLYLTRYSFQV